MKKKWSDYLLNHPALFLENSIVGLFRLAVKQEPEKEALRADGIRLTYEELERQSNQIARELTEAGVQKGEIIAVRTGRSAQTIAACLGIWKIGCAYVFMDSDCPKHHNALCMEECEICHEVTQELAERAFCRQSGEWLEEQGERDRLAVVVYTSGSTGKSKGVLISQANLAASVSNFGEIGFNSDDHYGCFASMMFIASVYDIAMSLSIGATLCLIPDGIRRNIREVARYYIAQKITATFLPPHMAMKYIGLDEGSPLRLLISGSEPVRNLGPRSYEIINVYASSEACAIASYYSVKDQRKAYPIGRVVSALRYYIVDGNGNQVSEGEEGELWISGPQVSRGYCKMPELTAKHFCPNPFCGEAPFERVFKTGDMVSVNEAGELVSHGRLDNMVKIRGFRVELTGVERHMLEYPGIKEVCCTAHTDSGGTNLLFGYYISEVPIDHEDFRSYLSTVLPYYMIPVGLVRCEDFPRTLSGKVARREFLPPAELDDRQKLAERYR